MKELAVALGVDPSLPRRPTEVHMRAKSLFLSGSLLFVAAFLVAFCSVARGAGPGELPEEILSFHSDLTVNSDASMLVAETIRVRAAGRQIKRGIDCDFPTRFTDRLGNTYVVRFDVQEVRRDGEPGAYRIRNHADGKRVFIEKRGELLPPGEHTYILTYATDRRVAFSSDHDELGWNVTRYHWRFPIQEASATVHLPKGIVKEALLLDAFTGPPGAVGTAFKSWVDADGSIQFVTTRALGPGEGLAIIVRWPKGYVREPTRDDEFHYFLRDHQSVVVGLAGLILLLACCLLTWLARVRMPPQR